MSDRINIAIHDRDDPSKIVYLDKWREYTIDDTVTDAANSFSVKPTGSEDVFKHFASQPAGQVVQIFCNDNLQLTGIVDEVETGASPDGGSFVNLSGRDMGGMLVDCAAPRISLRDKTFSTLVADLLKPWYPDYIGGIIKDNVVNFYKMAGIKKQVMRKETIYAHQPRGLSVPIYTVTKPAKDLYFTKGSKNLQSWVGTSIVPGGINLPLGQAKFRNVYKWTVRGGKRSPYYAGMDQDKLPTRIRAGERVWDVIARAAKQVAVMAFVTSDAFLCLTRPRYNEKQYGKLVFKRGHSGNVKAVTFRRGIQDRFALYSVQGQKPPRKGKGRKGTAKVEILDPGPAFYRQDTEGNLKGRLFRPTVIEKRKGCKDLKLLRRIARTKMEENALKAFDYQWEIAGHERDGVLWATDSCVEIQDEKHGRSGLYYIWSRQFVRDEEGGSRTILKLWPASIWLALDHDTITDTEYELYMRYKIDW